MAASPRFLTTAIVALLLAALPATSESAFNQSYQATGNLHLEVTGVAGLVPPASGTLTLATIPSGTIKKAFLYATQTNNATAMKGTFAGVPLPTVGPLASEALLITLSTYRWDVTANVMAGVNSYMFTLLDGLSVPVPVAGVALVVVWEDASTQPTRTVTIVDGVKQVGESGAETELMTFATVPAGSTDVWVFTTDDDASLGETIHYNGTNIGGPLVGNLGLNASVLKMNGFSVIGPDTLSITTQTDHLTWVLGATAVKPVPVPTEKSSWGKVKGRFR